MQKRFDPLLTIFIIYIIGFLAVKISNIYDKYHVFYECNIQNETKQFNGKEFRKFKREFEAFNKMTPDCHELWYNTHP